MSEEPPNAFERWRQSLMWSTGLGLTPEQKVMKSTSHQWDSCESMKKTLIDTSPGVMFMLKHLRLNNVDVKHENFVCEPCDKTSAGGFRSREGIITLCQNNSFGKQHMEDVMVHEMIHMYDHTKFNVDWMNLRHHACSEIRANSLSGDCKFTREFRRGHLSYNKHHQDCVRRRAILSVTCNPMCPDEAAAERAVNQVWESCFNDTRPYDEIF